MYRKNKRKELAEKIVNLIKENTIKGTENCYQINDRVQLQMTNNGIQISINGLYVDELSSDYNQPIHNALYETRMNVIDNFLK